MSRQSKAAKKNKTAKQFSETRKNGGKGPAKTTPVHGKKNVNWKKKEVQDARRKVLDAHGGDRTVLEKLKSGDSDKIKATK